jgi:class 3 adenylate cyclase/DNA-binding transcriptional MerR regulator
MDELSVLELAGRAGVTREDVRRLVQLGILVPGDGERPFTSGDVWRIRLASACGEGGLPLEGIGAAMAAGKLTLAFLDHPVFRWAGRTAETYDEVAARLGISMELLRRGFEAAGFAPPGPDELVREDDLDLLPTMLPLVQAPTLILHRRGFSLVPIAHGQYLADHIGRAKLVELPGSDVDLSWETPDLALDGIQEFLTGIRRGAEPGRVLATVLFTDIVGSTERAARAGDRRWRELLEVHDELADRLVEQFHGQLVKTTGDGILATFDGPGRAIRCAAALGHELAGIGLQIRAGLHTGEIELRDDDIGGIAVHIAARVMAAAGPGQILASRTVHDLVVGSDIAMDDLGTHPLKGIDGSWQLFAARP